MPTFDAVNALGRADRGHARAPVTRRPRRVLWLIKGLGPGGAERLLVEHAAAGDHERFTYEVAYVLDWKQHLVPELEALGVRTHCLGVRSRARPALDRTARIACCGASDYDVVHAHSPVVASRRARSRCARCRRARRPAFVYTEHNRWPSYRAETRCANQLTFGLNDAVVRGLGRRARLGVAALPRPTSRWSCTASTSSGCAPHLAERDAVRRELGVGDGECSRSPSPTSAPGKNYPGLLDGRALSRRPRASGAVRRRRPGPARGRDPRAPRDGAGSATASALLGYRDDTTRLIAAADLFVLASHHEGLPVTVMEALTLGVPVVAPRSAASPRWCDGENGILVTPESPAALADAIERVADR